MLNVAMYAETSSNNVVRILRVISMLPAGARTPNIGRICDRRRVNIDFVREEDRRWSEFHETFRGGVNQE
jgi:hypothetical protein